MTTGYFLIALHLVSVLHAVPERALPSFIKVCHKSDPALNECILESVKLIKPYLKTGIDVLNVPPCEPLTIPEVVLNQGGGPVSVKSTYRNVKAYGVSDFTLKSVKLDLDKDRVTITAFIPRIYMVGNYSIEGRILMLPILGNGLSKGNYSNIEATSVVQMEKVRKDGEIYMNVADFHVSFKVGDAHLHLGNLFNGNKQLGETMNTFLNENWSNVAHEMQPTLERTIGDLFKKFANKIFRSFPADVLLPA